eukprot:gene23159-28028_t
MGVALPALDVPSVKSSHKSGGNRHLDALAAGPNRVKSPTRYSGFSEEDAYNTHFDPACKRAPETLAPLPPPTPPARYGLGPASARDTEGVWTRQKKTSFDRTACLPPISHVSLPALSSNLPKAPSIPHPLQQLPEPQGPPSLPFLSSAPTLSFLSSVPNPPPRLPSPSARESFQGFKRPMQSNLLNSRTALPDIHARKPLPDIESSAANTAKTKLAPRDEGGITLHRPDAVRQVLQQDNEGAYDFDSDSVASRTSLYSDNAEFDATDDFYGLERGKHRAVE